MDDMDQSSVLRWDGRSQRSRKPPPLTYWEEFVATDKWYVRELTADIPVDEWEAAVADEDWESEGSEVASGDGEEPDPGYETETDNSEDEVSEDGESADDARGDEVDPEAAVVSDGSDSDSDGASEASDAEATDTAFKTPPAKRQRGGEGADAASEAGSGAQEL